jgi:hypothetical protein
MNTNEQIEPTMVYLGQPTHDNGVKMDAQMHTPLPWMLKHKSGIYHHGRFVCEVKSNNGNMPHIENENLANAALIVQAVNRMPAFDAMVEALTSIRDCWNGSRTDDAIEFAKGEA